MNFRFLIPSKKLKLRTAFVLLFMPAFALMGLQAQTLADITHSVESKYKNLKSVSMVFTKEVKSVNFEAKEKGKGKIWIKNPDKFRIDSDREQIISDGKIVWIYSKENKQVTKNRKEKVRNILDFGQSFANFTGKYDVMLKGNGKILDLPCLILELTPKTENEFITKLFLWIESKTYLIRKIEYLDINDNRISLLFNQISPNAKISDKKFTFQLPQGVELVDLTDIK